MPGCITPRAAADEGDSDVVIHWGEDPFAVPEHERDPVRRLRGRLASPVTGWTSYDRGSSPVGITVSSITINEGESGAVVGLIDPLSEFWDAVAHSKRFVVHVFDTRHRRLADQLAGRYPGPDARFENATIVASEWGPVLSDVPTRAYCTLAGFLDTRDSLIVNGTIDKVELATTPERPLVYFRGQYFEARPRTPSASRPRPS